MRGGETLRSLVGLTASFSEVESAVAVGANQRFRERQPSFVDPFEVPRAV